MSNRRPPRTLAVLATVAACLLAMLAGATAQARAPKDFFGVVPQSGLVEEDFHLMQTDGVGSIRQNFLWAEIERTRGVYDWGATDTLVREASEAGIEVFPVLYGTPAWAQTAKLQGTCGVTCGPVTPEARQAFARFSAAAVARYGPGGDFYQPLPDPPRPPPPLPLPRPCQIPNCGAAPVADPALRAPSPCNCANPIPITAWQVWNEQNSFKYWGPKEDLAGFAALLQTTAPLMRAEDPAADVVLGGMWGPPGIKIITPTQRYLKNLYRIDGIENSFDSIALHPYAPEFSSTVSQLEDVHKLLKRVGDPAAGIWITELGWASSGPKSEGLVKTKRRQAYLLRESYSLLLKRRLRWNIRGVFWYSWRDTGVAANICAWCPKSGLRTTRGEAKPAAATFRKLSNKNSAT